MNKNSNVKFTDLETTIVDSGPSWTTKTEFHRIFYFF